LPVLGLLLFTLNNISCIAPQGHSQPQNARPNNNEKMENIENITALAVISPFEAPHIIRKGEK
jgi:hypothetical protein